MCSSSESNQGTSESASIPLIWVNSIRVVLLTVHMCTVHVPFCRELHRELHAVCRCGSVMLTSLISLGALATRLTMGRSQGKKRSTAMMTKQRQRNLQVLWTEGKCHAFNYVLRSNVLSSHIYFWLLWYTHVWICRKRKELNKTLSSLPGVNPMLQVT